MGFRGGASGFSGARVALFFFVFHRSIAYPKKVRHSRAQVGKEGSGFGAPSSVSKSTFTQSFFVYVLAC